MRILQLPMRCARLSWDLCDSSEGDRAKLRCNQRYSSMCLRTHLTCADMPWRVYTAGFYIFLSGVLVHRTSDVEPKNLRPKFSQ